MNEERGESSIGILASRVLGEENHYATTCYHVCFNETLSEDINTVHNTLKEDYENNSEGCCDVSRADIAKFPTKQQFADAVLEAWKSCGITISHWVVSIEGHAVTDSNNDINMYHYHMALKLARRGRWLQVRRFLDETYAIQFSPPKMEQALASKKRKAREKNSTRQRKARKEKCLTVYDVSQLILAKKITTRLQLVCLAVEQNREGKSALAEFIANKNKVDEALEVAKEFSEAEAKFLRSKKSRIELLQEAKEGNCCEGCDGVWLETALKALQNNCISVEAFCTALYIALKKAGGNIKIYLYTAPRTVEKRLFYHLLKSSTTPSAILQLAHLLGRGQKKPR
ncbi:Hypothetical predicted protein [Paramuricea clavata]|uniref:Uncharacterized protein n=1 Tax=Paramuricea clavata TaxID=317549 RepID=A0A6S7H817_PARCT|nr:Hypothetical predicted protein [Paramuricea clavata]